MSTFAPAAPSSSKLDVMNFLNEIAGKFPAAISFASGRPAEQFFDIQEWLQTVPEFLAYFAAQRGLDAGKAANVLAQYGPTGGIVNELIAKQVAQDESIHCRASQVLLTAGCQEAMSLCVRHFCRDADDVVLVRSPAYIGIAGAAQTNHVEEVAFSCPDVERMVEVLRQTIVQTKQRGKRPKLLYLVPDFDNPTGTVIPQSVREGIIALCAEAQIVMMEDNPYGMFRFHGAPIPTMFSLDKFGCVIYLGTYSKTICPALRVGFAILPTSLFGQEPAILPLMESLLQDKSFSAVNTSQITQAIVGGVLLKQDCSLQKHVQPAIEFYRDNYQLMQNCLRAEFSDANWGVSWNAPEGGFFLVMSLPFSFKLAEAEVCANEYGVLVMPLSFFAYDDQCDCQIRLAYSNVNPSQIADGVARLSRFIKQRCGHVATALSE